jgi:Fic-DOC domain mobile mystery protein B
MAGPFDEPEDATPLDPEERAGLLQTWITFRHELNQAEQANIVAGLAWARRSRRPELLSVEFLRRFHRRLFGDVWAWAGRFRNTERNIGIAPSEIGVEIQKALDDARFWIDHDVYPVDEIAVRLHHRLVAIHPFPNGNGRVTRLLADLLAEQLGSRAFTWGRQDLASINDTRARYIEALRAADRHEIGPLLRFARS